MYAHFVEVKKKLRLLALNFNVFFLDSVVYLVVFGSLCLLFYSIQSFFAKILTTTTKLQSCPCCLEAKQHIYFPVKDLPLSLTPLRWVTVMHEKKKWIVLGWIFRTGNVTLLAHKFFSIGRTSSLIYWVINHLWRVSFSSCLSHSEIWSISHIFTWMFGCCLSLRRSVEMHQKQSSLLCREICQLSSLLLTLGWALLI